MYLHNQQSRLTRWVDNLMVTAIIAMLVGVAVLLVYSFAEAFS